MKIHLLFFSISFLVAGCSLTHKSVKSTGNGVFKISSSNLAFSSQEDLKSDIRQKAKEACGEKEVEYLTNFLETDVDLNLPLIVKVRCVA